MEGQNFKDNKCSRLERQIRLNLPSYTLIEEILNSVTHGLGAIFAIVSIVLLLIETPKNILDILVVSVYGFTLFLLYIISTIYHALNIGIAKKVFRVLDHCSIFLLIAGTYTPITFLVIGGKIGAVILSIVWTAGITGIVVNSINIEKYARFSMFCYIAMGWGIVFAMKPLIDSVTSKQLMFLVSGGIAYTLGAIMYVMGKKVRYMHSVWHMFVLLGSVLHFMMIYDFLKSY